MPGLVLLVDGSEIQPSPVEVGSLSHYLPGFICAKWLFGISEPSTVSQHNSIGSYTPLKFKMETCKSGSGKRDSVSKPSSGSMLKLWGGWSN